MNSKNKTLVAYFSCSKVTEKLAQKLASVVNGDVYEIEPEVEYTDEDLNWNNKKSRSSIEMSNMEFRPAISGKINNIDDYQTIFVGFPIWWYVAPTIINTFLESYDFSSKTVIPFATSGMSDVGESDKWLHGSCSEKTNWHPAKRFPSNVKESTLKNWVETLNL